MMNPGRRLPVKMIMLPGITSTWNCPTPWSAGKVTPSGLEALPITWRNIHLIFNEITTRSDAIHVNEMGYSPSSQKKYAYISQWMGTLGPFTDDDLLGRRFDIYRLGIRHSGDIGF